MSSLGTELRRRTKKVFSLTDEERKGYQKVKKKYKPKLKKYKPTKKKLKKYGSRVNFRRLF